MSRLPAVMQGAEAYSIPLDWLAGYFLAYASRVPSSPDSPQLLAALARVDEEGRRYRC